MSFLGVPGRSRKGAKSTVLTVFDRKVRNLPVFPRVEEGRAEEEQKRVGKEAKRGEK